MAICLLPLHCRLRHLLVPVQMHPGHLAVALDSSPQYPTQLRLVSVAACGWRPLPLSEPPLACMLC